MRVILMFTVNMVVEITTGYKKKQSYYFYTYLWDRIFNFLFVALSLFASFNDLFVRLHHHGIAILVTPLTIPSTIL